MKTINLAFVLFTINSFGQYQTKIDSTLNHNFKVLEMELGKIKTRKLDNKNFYYEEMILDNGKKVYNNKYVRDAVIFFEDISGIKTPRIQKAQGIYPILDERTYKLWKKWAAVNKKNILWCFEQNRPCLRIKS